MDQDLYLKNLLRDLILNLIILILLKEQSEEGYKNFCVIKCKIKTIEWLYLAAKGHRRALINFEGSKKFTWLVTLIIFCIFWILST